MGSHLTILPVSLKKKKKSIKNIFLRIRIFLFLSFSSAAKQCSRPVYAGTGGVGEIRDESWRGNTWWVLHVFVNARIDYTENVKVKVILSVFIKNFFPHRKRVLHVNQNREALEPHFLVLLSHPLLRLFRSLTCEAAITRLSVTIPVYNAAIMWTLRERDGRACVL